MPRSISRSPPRKGRHRTSARSPSPGSHRHSSRRRRESHRSRSPGHQHGHGRCVTVSKQWALHAVIVQLETAKRGLRSVLSERWVLLCVSTNLMRKGKKSMKMRWEQTGSVGMMMMIFMEGGGFHAVAAWRKAGRLWECPLFRNLPFASDVSRPSLLW